jgi:putative Mg2+ transporter-C (MgtC) family protein
MRTLPENVCDRYAAVPELRIHLRRHLSGGHPRSRPPVAFLWPLPLHPVGVPAGMIQVVDSDPQTQLLLLARLLAAGALSAVLGWEREAARKPAGLRTHMLVGIASALFTVLAELAVVDYPGTGNGMQADPIRVIQAVAIGVGFLGSGVIFVSRSSDSVQGLTTAGSIWATAAIGIAAGLGYYVLALGATVLLMLVLRVMSRFDRD